MSTDDLLKYAFGFAAGAYGFAFLLHCKALEYLNAIEERITSLTLLVTNHQEHKFEDLENQIQRLKEEITECGKAE